MTLKQPSIFFRALVLGAQGVYMYIHQLYESSTLTNVITGVFYNLFCKH